MRVVTWNMGCGPRKYRATHASAWQYLLEVLEPDVALVQEALVELPALVADAGRIVVHEHGTADAGTAIFVQSRLAGFAAPFLLVSRPEAYLAAADIVLGELSFVAVSVHVYPDAGHQRHLESAQEEICRTLAGRVGIVGGDFNAARSFAGYCRRFFDAMATASFHDCHYGKHGAERQSYWTKGNVQDDHLFVSAAWASRVESCEVIDNARVRTLSDHGPVVLDLALGTPD